MYRVIAWGQRVRDVSSEERHTQRPILRHALTAAFACYCYVFFYCLKKHRTDADHREQADENNNKKNINLTQQQVNVIHALSGSLGSALSITILYPLETVRTRLQVDAELTAQWSLFLVYQIFKREGLINGLYRGWASLLVALMSLNFVYFYSFHSFRLWLQQLFWNHDESGLYWKSTLLDQYLSVFDKVKHIDKKMLLDLIAGYFAGCVAVCVTGPLWLVNTRLKLQGVSKTDNRQYRGMFHCLYTIYQQEGLFTLWTGTFTSIILSINPAIQLAAYEMLKRHHLLIRNGPRIVWWIVSKIMQCVCGGTDDDDISGRRQERNHVENDTSSSAAEHFLNALLSKFVATVITYPIQLMQTRQRSSKTNDDVQQQQQQQRLSNDNIDSESKPSPLWGGVVAIQDLMEIIQQKGFLGLYRGLESKLIQTCLNSALMFVTYEKLVQLLTDFLHGDGNTGGAS